MTDEHTIAWQAVMEAYATDSIYLGEWAQQLQHMSKYEIPSMKKKVTRMKTGVPELRRKAGECKAMSKQSRAAFEAECARMGIKGENVEAELREMSKRLPGVFAEVGKLLETPDVVQARELYVDLVAYVHKLSAEETAAMLPTLARAHASGVQSEPEPAGGAGGGLSAEASDAEAEIDWGIEAEPSAGDAAASDSGGGGAEADIDWGIGIDAVEEATIDWGIGGDDNDGGGGGGGGGGELEITLESSGEGGGGGGPVELSSVAQRAQLVNDLLELEAFLKVRVEEMGKTEAINLLASMDFPLSRLDRDQVAKLRTSVSECIEKINGEETHQLIMLNSSERFLKRLAQSTSATRKSAEQMVKRGASLEEQMQAQLEKESVEIPKFEELKAKAKFLKLGIEKDLSAMYNGRPVFVQGSFE